MHSFSLPDGHYMILFWWGNSAKVFYCKISKDLCDWLFWLFWL